MSTKNTYRLVNPFIEGSLDTVVRSRNSFNAGKKLYNNISNHFTNHVNDFYMTIENVETKDLSHFRINEERTGDKGSVEFDILRLNDNFDPDLEKKLVANMERLDKLDNQSGGRRRHRHYDDDSSSDSCSSDSDYYRIPVQPISRFVYYYMPYYKLRMVGINPYDAARIFMPTFNLPINPSVEVRFDLYKYF